MIPVIIGSTLLIFALVYLMPGDPIAAMFGDKPPAPAVEAAIRAKYNFDQPFIMQYLLFMKGFFTGNLGQNFAGQSVTSILARVYPTTVKLALMAFAFEAIFGVLIGTISGMRKGKFFDSTFLVLSLLLIAMPTFVFGFIMQIVLGMNLRLLPATAGPSPGFLQLLMPAIVLGGVSLAYVIRLTRSTVAENAQADFVTTAKAKGLSKSRLTIVHILRNSLIPVVTYLGADLGALMAGAIVTERVFNVDGVGNQLYQSILRGEAPVVVSLVTLLILVFVISNLLVDVLYAVLDPRIRYE
jgi:oligopeptide transport system permease protein